MSLYAYISQIIAARKKVENIAFDFATSSLKKGTVEKENFEEEILPKEVDYIEGRSGRNGLSNNRVGLALSGGGIRSAVFNLGLLQALETGSLFKRVDYLSTVSGGGYIGASMAWLMNQRAGAFPYNDKNVLSWLRRHASYLVPGYGLTSWSLVSTVLRGSFANILAFFPIFIGIMCLLTWNFFPDDTSIRPSILLFTVSGVIYTLFRWMFSPNPILEVRYIFRFLSIISSLISCYWLYYQTSIFDFTFYKIFPFFSMILFFSSFALADLVISFLLYACASGPLPLNFLRDRLSHDRYGTWSKIAIYGLLFSSLPIWMDLYYSNGSTPTPSVEEIVASEGIWSQLGGYVTILGTFGSILTSLGWTFKKDAERGKKITIVSLRIGAVFIIIFFIFFLFYTSLLIHSSSTNLYVIVFLFFVFSIIIGFTEDVNHVSLWRYYRDRLLEAFMFAEPPDKYDNWELTKDDSFSKADDFYLASIKSEDMTPYLLINTNLVTGGSKDPKLRNRGGANFVFSPNFVGSDATGYCPTSAYLDGKMSLASAFAVSGAAINPNQGVAKSRPLAVIMALLNLRLGVWYRNPKFELTKIFARKRFAPPFWHRFIFREMMGYGFHENSEYVYLTDGGHFENLGLYELVRRQLPYIIIADASADPDYQFEDLGRAIALARTDFDADIKLDVKDLIPNDDGISKQAFTFGTITYQARSKNPSNGKLIYIKTTMFDGLTEDIRSYHRQNREFPDQTTLNQFFDERQFEAYRELGFQIGMLICKHYDSKSKKLDPMFSG